MKKTVFSWSGNAFVNYPIIIALVGFFYSALLFKSGYHDLVLKDKKELVLAHLHSQAMTARDNYVRLLPKKDSASEKANFARARNTFLQKNKEIYKLSVGNADTALVYYKGYFAIDRDTYKKALTSKTNNGGITSCLALIEDTSILSYGYHYYTKQPISVFNKEIGLIEFITKYPEFGFWYILAIAQMTAWFMIIALVTGVLIQTNNTIPEYSYTVKNAWIHFLIPTITIGVFAILLYVLLVKDHVITERFFLDHFNDKMKAYSTVGYLAAAYCFGSYLFLSNKLELLDKNETPQDTDSKARYMEKFKQLKAAFDFSFFCSALILSLFVFFVGVLYHAVNQIEAINYFKILSGKNFIDDNYVYLVGLLHSLILAIFYIPVKIRFRNMEISQQTENVNEESNPKKYIKVLLEVTGNILVTLSPLLATFVQKLISLLVGE